uniref:Uncharacterized protein n=1 Tax=Anopheles coluzzii TaxID=1518534 RepID=A0A8W7P477_ANOCL
MFSSIKRKAWEIEPKQKKQPLTANHHHHHVIRQSTNDAAAEGGDVDDAGVMRVGWYMNNDWHRPRNCPAPHGMEMFNRRAVRDSCLGAAAAATAIIITWRCAIFGA